ncbi:hypothetical protein H4R33_005685 [Dimargaris cristalligena]|uniref:Uncharacterized protein n=1 Tax=Dimargaris cristalligena TaxID=215637 RepID=A0A4V1J3W7_9FUNG|nr:hypothetical protein H4R33_005685 [Dimargaris cristalligena]RKP33499.1 hypothetical protein BJ085DRAFT_40129 [Dimargaris cristalligena]|eukprot:RKP33499.1 hypothetical protein BJ085DRAFT_40129 [Dimargaris cristalligena]
MSSPRFAGCLSAPALRWLSLTISILYTTVAALRLLTWSLSQPALVLVYYLATLALCGLGLRGILRSKVLLVRMFALLVCFDTILSFGTYIVLAALAFAPRTTSLACSVITQSNAAKFSVEVCLANYRKFAIALIAVFTVMIAFNLYFACVIWTFYRQLRDGQAGASNDSHMEYTAVAKEEESEKV